MREIKKKYNRNTKCEEGLFKIDLSIYLLNKYLWTISHVPGNGLFRNSYEDSEAHRG